MRIIRVEGMPKVVRDAWSAPVFDKQECGHEFYEELMSSSKSIGKFGTHTVLISKHPTTFALDDSNLDIMVWVPDEVNKSVLFVSEVSHVVFRLDASMTIPDVDVKRMLSKTCRRQSSIQMSPYASKEVLSTLKGVSRFVLDRVLITENTNAVTDTTQTHSAEAVWKTWITDAVKSGSSSRLVLGVTTKPDRKTINQYTQLDHLGHVGMFLSNHFLREKEEGLLKLVMIGKT